VDVVLSQFDDFLVDHAACERKASATALSFVVRYPDRTSLLDPLIALAREELLHFHQVYDILTKRGLRLAPDIKDPYVGALLKHCRSGGDERLLDRLLAFGIVEARGCERFGILAEALPEGELKDFYTDIARAEARHHGLFVRLARGFFDEETVQTRLDELLTLEAKIIADLPFRASLH
jgi:tRNA-(ms[2]io[6]A)-hydroxylase